VLYIAEVNSAVAINYNRFARLSLTTKWQYLFVDLYYPTGSVYETPVLPKQ